MDATDDIGSVEFEVGKVEQLIIPVRMITEYVYCHRLFYLMFVDAVWEDNIYTENGRALHSRVDEAAEAMPSPPGADEEPVVARSVTLGSEILGIVGKLDLLEVADELACPVETKRGAIPNNEHRAWDADRVQLMCQGLLLREHGYNCRYGVIYYASSHRRVQVDFDAHLEAVTLQAISQARQLALSSQMPSPLDDSPKCMGCSLSGICLPDETNYLNGAQPEVGDIRRLYPMRDDALPMYVQVPGSSVGKSGESLVVRKHQEVLATIPIKDISQLVVCGNVSISAQCIRFLCERNIPIVYLTMGYWFSGITAAVGPRNAYVREAQFHTAASARASLELAKRFVVAKAHNQRTLLRRNSRNPLPHVLAKMRDLIRLASKASSVDQLMGVEGSLAAHYFGHWDSLVTNEQLMAGFHIECRNRRPPRDPINAMLSFGYAMLTKEVTIALMAEGLDPYWGFMHTPRHGRPALALDLMEEFRPVIVDSAVLSAINRGMVEASDFVTSSAGCNLSDSGRKAFLRCYEGRLDSVVTHSLFKYTCSWRSIIRVQARLLAKVLRGEVSHYYGIMPR